MDDNDDHPFTTFHLYDSNEDSYESNQDPFESNESKTYSNFSNRDLFDSSENSYHQWRLLGFNKCYYDSHEYSYD